MLIRTSLPSSLFMAEARPNVCLVALGQSSIQVKKLKSKRFLTIHIKRVTIGDICLLKSFSRAFTICWHRRKSLQLNAKSWSLAKFYQTSAAAKTFLEIYRVLFSHHASLPSKGGPLISTCIPCRLVLMLHESPISAAPKSCHNVPFFPLQ